MVGNTPQRTWRREEKRKWHRPADLPKRKLISNPEHQVRACKVVRRRKRKVNVQTNCPSISHVGL